MSADIIQRARDGDRNALNLLLEKHRDLAFSIALKYLGNPADAEDVVQDAFVKVFLNIHKFRNEAAFSTWLFRIIYSEAVRHLNRQQRILSIRDEVKGAADYEEPAPFRDERGRMVKSAMQCLSANEYLVMNLFYLLEKDIREIRDITGHSPANIKVLLHRGRKKVADYIGKHEEIRNNI